MHTQVGRSRQHRNKVKPNTVLDRTTEKQAEWSPPGLRALAKRKLRYLSFLCRMYSRNSNAGKAYVGAR